MFPEEKGEVLAVDEPEMGMKKRTDVEKGITQPPLPVGELGGPGIRRGKEEEAARTHQG